MSLTAIRTRCRAYRIPVGLLLTISTILAGAGSMAGAPGDAPAYHMDVQPAKRIRATLTSTYRAPGFHAKEWIVYVPVPPNLPGQTDASLTTDPPGVRRLEMSQEQQPVMVIHIPVKDPSEQQRVTIHAVYEVTISTRYFQAGAPAQPVPALSTAERQRDLAPSYTYDFPAATFQHWLTQYSLRRSSTESDVSFAYRVFQFIAKNFYYIYIPDQDRRASNICIARQSDCAGLGHLYVAIMRANGIPCRARVGRETELSTTRRDGQIHVKPEFFAEGIGWTPVEVSGVVDYRDVDMNQFFGKDPADQLVEHMDADLVIVAGDGSKKMVRSLQTPYFTAKGDGSMAGSVVQESWKVEQLSMPEQSP